jgi:Leucine-rich repeat (LRR) protein
LSGEIPSEIGNLTNLNTLVIGDNQFTGLIPEEICNINIDPIFDDYDWSEEIFDGNKFCPPYPDCIQQYIDLEDQDLTDTNCFSCDDEDVYELWGTCYHVDYTLELDLSNNELTGEIPQEIENFVNLDWLDLSDNNLSGLINESICGIDIYYLVNNTFCGPFPDCTDNNSIFPQEDSYDCEEFCNNDIQVNLWGTCYDIDETIQINLSNNGISGEIPLEIGDLVNLERLFLNGNELSGGIPLEIGEI